MQRNWIGRSEGAEVDFRVDGSSTDVLPVFTTRPDTLFGATFFVLAPEHPLVEQLVDRLRAGGGEMRAYVRHAAAKRSSESSAQAKEKTGVFTGCYASIPSTASASRSGSPTTC